MDDTLEVAPRSDAPRIPVVTTVLPFPVKGGGHKRTLRLLEALERGGAVPHVLTAGDAEPAGVEALGRRGWGVETFAEPRAGMLGRAAQHLARLPAPYVPALGRRLRELAAGAPAFVVVEQTQSAMYVRDVGSLPYVLSLHNVDSELMRTIASGTSPLSREWLGAWNRWHAMRSAERRAVRGAAHVLAVSREDAASLDRLGGAPIVVPNGVDDELFDVPLEPGDEERVLFFGQFDYAPNARGVARFLEEGWPALARERPSSRLVLAGKGMSPELEAQAGSTAGVEVLGFVEDVARQLAAARLVVVPVWEGGGTRLKVLESLAAARPVVGTPLGVENIGFEHGAHGLVSGTPEGLAESCAALLADRRRAVGLGRAGRALAEGYRWAEITKPLEELGARLLVRTNV